MKGYKIFTFTFILLLIGGCDFMDVVPNNVATIKDNAFSTRSNARHFLYTCYHYMPNQGNRRNVPGIHGLGELVQPKKYNNDGTRLTRGLQNVQSPLMNFWEGGRGGTDLYQGIRKCNIFLENIDDVNGMQRQEKKKWAAEAKFLKAYYLFYLTRMYGPIVLPRKLIPISAASDKTNRMRKPVDECFKYIVKLLDEASKNLPDKIKNEVSNLGRITKPIALAIKAKVLVTAASSLFNGNKSYKGFHNKDGERFFNPKYNPEKWQKAVAAAYSAISLAQDLGYKLYHFKKGLGYATISDTTVRKMSIRNSVTKSFNSEVIWANTTSTTGTQNLQNNAMPHGVDPQFSGTFYPRGYLGTPFKITDLFYTNHGVPLRQDKTRDYSEYADTKEVGARDKYYLKKGYTTANYNFNREPRFYADLGFDGSIWFGQGNTGDISKQFYIAAKNGQPSGIAYQGYSTTGYWPKKLANYKSVVINSGVDWKQYVWPVMRLDDLYLLYAEAKNEADGPGPEVYKYINLIRKRAGLETVQKSWKNYSKKQDQYQTKKGMRKIIHQERRIELVFEGKNYWALRRWKEMGEFVNGRPISGWSIKQSKTKTYYTKRISANYKFSNRDYLWPLSENTLINNPNLTQNPGWGR